MNMKRYLKDKYPYLLAAVFIIVVINVFLNAFDLPRHAVLFVTILVTALFTVWFFGEFVKRKRYYDNLLDVFEKLDAKYLISELMDEGSFADSEIFYDILKRANKAMSDEVASYKAQTRDYLEYLESWIHEIKTPISSALLTIENNRNEVTSSIEQDLGRIENYVQNVLFYARSNSVEKDYIIKETTLDSMVKKALRENSRLIIENNTSIKMDGLEITAFTDEKWVNFMLGQVISNCIKYSPAQGSEIIFRGRQKPYGTVLEVSDNGIGIPPADLPRVFEKGFTGQNGRKYTKSTGMGLFLCKKLCDKLGIGISASSGEYTTITFVFPKTDMFFR